MAYTYLAHVASGSPDTFTHTSGAIDTTGADLLVVYVAELESQGDTVLSDSKSNTWISLTEQKDVGTASLRGVMWYAKNPTVGSGHTFTVTDTSGGARGSLAAAAFSGAHLTAPLDQQNGKVDIDAGLANTTNGITPSEDDTLTITGLAFTPNSATIAINTGEAGWAITDSIDATANHMGVSLAYKIQTTATATDPTWSYNNNEYAVTTIASFKIAAGGGGGPVATRDLTTLLCGQ